MKIAIIGSGNVGGVLARKWIDSGHSVLIGARFPLSEKNMKLAEFIGEDRFTSIENAVFQSEIILIATPATSAIEVAKSLGNTEGKIIIDSMNIVMGKGPVGYTNTTQAILDHTNTLDVVKCFNTTGFNNMLDPQYANEKLDLFVAGDSEKGKDAAIQLAKDAGFAECYSIGGNDKFELIEQFAFFWINLALFQGQGRNIGFKLLKR
ncbi:MAG: NADPH-dependent F420 reductase [Bacteroidia bacterium]